MPRRSWRAAIPLRGGEPTVGQTFAGRYDIQGVLGRGGMGVVYRAHDRDLDDAVAIKTLRSEALSADPSLLDRFKQEIRLARRITHPNILRTHDLGETGGLRYLSMEFVKGLTLKQLVEAGDILPTPVGLRIAKQICAGLAAAHEVGVIHRDIKPQNIIIEATGGLKIMDFGIARLKEERGMTAEGTVVGTPDYMSPEQARGQQLDFRSDIYSTGVVLYEVFTGTHPLRGRDAAGRRAQAHPGGAALAADAKPEDRSADLPDHPEVHAEGPEGPLPDRQRSLRGADPGHGAGGVSLRRALAFAGGVLAGGVRLRAGDAADSPGAGRALLRGGARSPKFSFRWDFLARYDNVQHLHGYEKISRGRFELRPEIDFDPWSDFRIGVRGIFDYGTDKYAYPEQDNYISRWASADRWYVLWTPGTFALRAGRFGMPLAASELFWDRDIQTPGIAAVLHDSGRRLDALGRRLLRPAALQRPDAHRGRPGRCGRTAIRRGSRSRRLSRSGGSSRGSSSRLYFRENTTTTVNGELAFTSKFNVGDLFLRLRFPIGTVPILVSLDGFMNFSANNNQKLAYEGRRRRRPGRHARGVSGAFTPTSTSSGTPRWGPTTRDDWWYHTWYEGHRVGVAWTFLPRLYLQASFSTQRRLDVHDWVNRVLVDLVKMF